MKSKKVRILAGALVFIVIAAIYLAYRIRTTQAQATAASSQQNTTTVTRGTIASSLVAAGTVRARQTANLSWQASGVVGSISVKIGDTVKAGQTLASLDPGSLPQSIISAQVDLASAQQSLDNLMTSQLPKAQAMQAVDTAQQALDDYLNNFSAMQGKTYADLVTAQQSLTDTQKKRDALNYDRASQDQIDTAQANYDQAEAAVKSAQKAYNKVSNLPPGDPKTAAALSALSAAESHRDSALSTLNWYTGSPSTEDIAAADSAVAQAKAALATAQSAWDKVKDGQNNAQLAVLQATLADTKAAYERIKDGPDPNDVASLKNRISGDQVTINQQFLTAPFDGTITDLQILPRDQASPSKAAFRMDDLSHLLVDVSIAEIDLSKVALDQPVNLTFDALTGKQYHGKVVQISQVGTSNQGVVQFGVTVEITDADKNVRPGMTAAVRIVTAQKAGVLMVANRAIRNTGGQRSVTVLFEGSQINVPVTIGITSDTMSEITSEGLKEGDELLLNSSANTTSGTNGGRAGGFGIPLGGFNR